MYGEIELTKKWGHLPGFKRYGREFRSECPRCGGGHSSDRFIMRLPDADFDVPRGWCRQCRFFETSRGVGEGYTDEQREEFMRQAAEDAQKRQAEGLSKLQKLAAQINVYHEMKAAERAEWHRQGLSDASIERWRLGYVNDRGFGKDENDEWVRRNALVIPVWHREWEMRNVQFRILNPPSGFGKYRPVAGLPMSLFLTTPDAPISGKVFVVEGAKKGMKLSQELMKADGELHNIVAIPSASPSMEMLQEFSDVDLMYLNLDPDAYVQRVDPMGNVLPPMINRVVNGLIEVNPKMDIRVVQMHVKVDDFFNEKNGGDVVTLRRFYEHAIRVRPRREYEKLYI